MRRSANISRHSVLVTSGATHDQGVRSTQDSLRLHAQRTSPGNAQVEPQACSSGGLPRTTLGPARRAASGGCGSKLAGIRTVIDAIGRGLGYTQVRFFAAAAGGRQVGERRHEASGAAGVQVGLRVSAPGQLVREVTWAHAGVVPFKLSRRWRSYAALPAAWV
jgi:hypothetical protein